MSITSAKSGELVAAAGSGSASGSGSGDDLPSVSDDELVNMLHDPLFVDTLKRDPLLVSIVPSSAFQLALCHGVHP
jgi:hypothetical protein